MDEITYADSVAADQRREYLNVQEAGDYSRLSRSTLYRLNADGLLPFRKVGRRTLIRRSDLDRMIEGD